MIEKRIYQDSDDNLVEFIEKFLADESIKDSKEDKIRWIYNTSILHSSQVVFNEMLNTYPLPIKEVDMIINNLSYISHAISKYDIFREKVLILLEHEQIAEAIKNINITNNLSIKHKV